MTPESVRTIESATRADAFRMRALGVLPKRILCATDLSERSQRAVTRAALLANQLDAQLTFLYVAASSQFVDGSAALRDRVIGQFVSSGFASRVEPAIQLRAGDYAGAIASVAKDIDADLIVLGGQRRNPLESLIGTTAERVIAAAGRPALIVNVAPQTRYAAVMIAAELSDAFGRVVRIASSLKFLDARSVSIVHGFESPYRGPLYAEGFDVRAARRYLAAWESAARTELLRKLDLAGVESSRFRLFFQQAGPIRAIQRVVRRVQPDLLIVGMKSRTIFNRIVRGSVANDALRTIACDILVASQESKETGALH